ncbi:amino acid adenylation domain-containing protein [Stenotrophomonas sp. LGBM10]|uniref:amino acid adenylation domain-containing protein n=1 Tax=Stenotrophomonas sp. LGBM10 TaxID=3390038 RepID=UPI00398B37E9
MQGANGRDFKPAKAEPTQRFASLVDLGRHRAVENGGQTAFVFLKDGHQPQASWTYAQLDERARAIAAWLQARGGHGERVILLYSSGLDFIAGFMGCLYAGALAVPVYTPQARDEHWQRLEQLSDDADAGFVLTTADMHRALHDRLAASARLGTVPCCLTDTLDLDHAAGWVDPRVRADDLAFLQYTSGSTGAPKGVMVSHGNLLHNQMLMQAAFDHDADSVFVSWLPLFHDMGLIGNVLHTLYLGARCYLMTPVAFLQQPARWLQAISDYRGTSSFAPDFAFALCAERVTDAQKATLDLSSWTFALNGAEPVRAATLERFNAAFAPCGFNPQAHYPGYGLAEATLFVSGRGRGRGADMRHFDRQALEQGQARRDEGGAALVGCGRAWFDLEVEVVDPATGRRCDEGQVGEIWVRGPSVAQGYWRRPDATAETFAARLPDVDADHLRTGDLGFLSDGGLFINGRLKELIIVRGRNLYPQDVEAAVQRSWKGFRSGGGAAFAIEQDGEERLVVVQEVDRAALRGLQVADAVALAREAVALACEARLHELVLIGPAHLPKTSSGKIQRGRIRQHYLQDSIEGRVDAASRRPRGSVSAAAAVAQAPLQRLQSLVAPLLAIPADEVACNRPLLALGLDSLALVDLAVRVEAEFRTTGVLQRLFDGASLEEVAVALDARTEASPASPAPAPAPLSAAPGDRHPLSANQAALWYLYRLQPESAAYNVALPIRCTHPLDRERLGSAVTALLVRHPVLGCRYLDGPTGPEQVVQAPDAAALQPMRAAHGVTVAELPALLQRLAARPFRLDVETPFRVEHLRGDDGDVLMLVAHHICVDLASMLRLIDELAALYADEALPPSAAAGFFQHVEDEARHLRLGSDADRAYWRDTLPPRPPVLDLPRRGPRPRMQDVAGDSVYFDLSAADGAAVDALAVRLACTPFSIFAAAFAWVLHRYARQPDVLIGVPTLGRSTPSARTSVGYFVNTVVLHSAMSGDGADLDFMAFHAGLWARLRGAVAHARLPFAQVVDALALERDASVPPLVQVLLNLHTSSEAPGLAALIQGQQDDAVALRGWRVHPVRLSPGTSPLDLSLSLVERGDGRYEGRIDFATALFEPGVAASLADSFARVLRGVVAQPTAPLRQIRLFHPEMQPGWGEQRDWGPFLSVDAQFRRQAALSPDRIALHCEGDTMTYAALDAQSDAIAAALLAQGVGSDDVVAVSMRRSAHLLVALLGTMKAGAAYLPLDPDLPAARIQAILETATPKAGIHDDAADAVFPGSRSVSALRDDGAQRRGVPRVHAPAQAAYVIYTSGSTGQPKGVVNTHAALANRLQWMQRHFALQPDERALLKTPYTFDVSVWELFWPLMVGAGLVIARHDGHRDADYLHALMREQRVGVVHFVPSMLAAFVDAQGLGVLPSLRQIVCSGEELGIDVLARCQQRFPTARVANLYGPTEAAIDVSCWDCDDQDTRTRVPIGHPIDNVQMVVLDDDLQPVPRGVAGELYLGGEGLARGYAAAPALTAARFVPSPVPRVAGERLYRTGDLARQREDGAIEYLGRLDFQVKLRGQRLELGEIDALAGTCDSVAGALTVLARHANGEPYLLCHAVRAGAYDDQARLQRLTDHLRARLPSYAVPERFTLLDAWPLNSSGKIDRAALPTSASQAPVAPDEDWPLTPLGMQVLEAVRELLAVPEASAADNFFSLGGHSLLATRLCSRLREAAGVHLQVADVLLHPVIGDLARLVEQRHVGSDPDTTGAPPAPEVLSPAQQRLWFVDQLQGPSAAYTMPLSIRLVGVQTPATVRGHVADVLALHPELHACYVAGTDGPQRVPGAHPQPPVALTDLSGFAGQAREDALALHLQALAGTVFDLADGPICQADVAWLGDGQCVLTVLAHHIAADGGSLAVLLRQIAAAWGGADTLRAGDHPGYCQAQQAARGVDAWQAGLHRIQQRLKDMPPLLELPTDRPRPAVAGIRGGVVSRVLSMPERQRVESLAAATACSPFMLLAAAFQLLMWRYSGNEDVPLGTAVDTRDHALHEDTVGLFVNTLVLRSPIQPAASFQTHLRRFAADGVTALQDAAVPFDLVVDTLAPSRSLSHGPLVQAMVTLQPDVVDHCAWPDGVQAAWIPLHTATAKFDVNLLITFTRQGMRLELEYRRDLFASASAEAMLAHYIGLLASALDHPSQAVAALPLAEVVDPAAAVRSAVPGVQGDLPTRYSATAQRFPHAVAVNCAEQELTHGQLDTLSGQWAAALREAGIGRGSRVGLCMERGCDLIVAVLAILKAGAAYVPLDPRYPPERLLYMARDANVAGILGHGAHAALFADEPLRYLTTEALQTADVEPLAGVTIDPQDAAYVIYTSGSTGRPKGVVVTHANVLRLFEATAETFSFGRDDVWALFHSYAFDFSVWEIWGALLYGGRLAVVPHAVARSADEVGQFVRAQGVTVLNQTPSAFQQLLQADLAGPARAWPALRYVVFGGEALNIPSLAPWFERYPQGPVLVNMYGITETTVHVTSRIIQRADLDAPGSVIGEALADLAMYILDDNGCPQPAGVPGELHVSGPGLARGYLGRADLTAERFLPDPFSPIPGARMYRSGDLAVRRAHDGQVHYLGRRDQQVKVRGFRIELGEVEAACAGLPGIGQVVARATGDGQLAAHVVLTDGGSLDAAGWVRQLRSRLPEFMVPGIWVPMAAVPLTRNGKVDETALATARAAVGAADTAVPVGGADETERLVLQCWSQLVGSASIGRDDDFFSVGGNSLLAARASARLQAVFAVRLSVRDLFDHPTASGLAARIRSRTAGREQPLPVLGPRSGSGAVVATTGQQRLWFLERLGGDPTLYTMPGVFHIEGPLDVPRLSVALDALVARHQVLHTSFIAIDGVLQQHVRPARTGLLEVVDLRGAGSAAQATRLAELVDANASHAFDLAAGTPLRCTLVRLADAAATMLLNIHHIAFDGSSLAIFCHELRAFYADGAAALPAPALQYADYAAWQHDTAPLLEPQLAYWRDALQGAPPLLELSTASLRPPVQSHRGGLHRFEVPTALQARLGQRCRTLGVTPFVVLSSAYALLLSHFSAKQDLVIGTPVDNRQSLASQSLIGFFANTLALRFQLQPTATVADLLQQTRARLVHGLSHQELPFERVIEHVQPDRALSHSPLFQHMFVMEQGDEATLVLDGVRVTAAPAGDRAAKFDLTLSMRASGGALQGSLEFACDLFTASAAAQLADAYVAIVDALLDDPERRLDALAPRWPQPSLLEGTRVDRCARPLHARVLDQALRTPVAVAIDDGARRLSYAGLAAEVVTTAHALQCLGVLPGDRVAVCLPRTASLVVTLLAIQSVGAAYVPLDPAYPRQRLLDILDDAVPALLVVDAGVRDSVLGYVGDVRVTTLEEALAGTVPANAALPAVPVEAVAYVIYTSGSTGRPKGVAIRHVNANVMLDWARTAVDDADLQGVFACTSVCFDLSVYELFLPLVAGGTVVLGDNALALHDAAARQALTLVNTVPSAIDALTRERALPASVRVVNLAGEALPARLVERLHDQSPALRVYNLYGPSEDTTYSTWALMPRRVGLKPAIGVPIANTRAYVLDSAGEPVPLGVPGELYLSGDGVALGYLGRPCATAERFLPDPFATEPGAVMYRTGDLVRCAEDGALEFIGRADQQVKLRGFRIELGDVEHHLGRLEGVGECAVLVLPSAGDDALVAFVSPAEGHVLQAAGLHDALSRALPAHMLPTRYVVQPALARTANGKLDRRALALDDAAATPAGHPTPAVPASTDAERDLLALWREMLPGEVAGVDSNFFLAGGHSLLMLKMLPRVEAMFGVPVSMRAVFEHPDVRGLARHLSAQQWLANADRSQGVSSDELVDEGSL